MAYCASDAKPGAFYAEHAAADLTCYRKDGSMVSLTLYGDAYIATPDGQVFRCPEGIPRLRMLSPKVQAFDLRMQCAADLRSLWHRLRLYYIAQLTPTTHHDFWQRYLQHGYTVPPDALEHSEKAYPLPTQWCDALRRGYRLSESSGTSNQEFPIAGKGKCHYAMNPNCGFDSPGDMVLLFETTTGWNQHGGPELFSLKNHDPRGGNVLLNDGTVKFIRSKEELRNLKWK